MRWDCLSHACISTNKAEVKSMPLNLVVLFSWLLPSAANLDEHLHCLK